MNLLNYLRDDRDIILMYLDLIGHFDGKFYRGMEAQLILKDFVSYGLPYQSFEEFLRRESPWLYHDYVESMGSRAGKRYLERHGKEHEDYQATTEMLFHPHVFLAFLFGVVPAFYKGIKNEIEIKRLNRQLSKKVANWENFYKMFNEKVSRVRVFSPDRDDPPFP